MNDIYVTLTGRVAAEPRQHTFGDGARVTSLRVLTSHRYFDKKTGQWADGDRVCFVVRCWRALADNVHQSIQVGHPVVVSGRLRIREFGQEGDRRFVPEVEASSVGHDLRWGIGAFSKPDRMSGVASVSTEIRDRLDEETQDWALTGKPESARPYQYVGSGVRGSGGYESVGSGIEGSGGYQSSGSGVTGSGGYESAGSGVTGAGGYESVGSGVAASGGYQPLAPDTHQPQPVRLLGEILGTSGPTIESVTTEVLNNDSSTTGETNADDPSDAGLTRKPYGSARVRGTGTGSLESRDEDGFPAGSTRSGASGQPSSSGNVQDKPGAGPGAVAKQQAGPGEAAGKQAAGPGEAAGAQAAGPGGAKQQAGSAEVGGQLQAGPSEAGGKQAGPSEAGGKQAEVSAKAGSEMRGGKGKRATVRVLGAAEGDKPAGGAEWPVEERVAA